MTLFIDASALIAIIAAEDDGTSLAARVVADADPIWSPMSCWETIAGLRYSHGYLLKHARHEVDAFALSRPFRLVGIAETERMIALDCHERYGRGSGHGAKLNMGDCFAYACAKANGAVLLYKGDDFAKTDLA